MAAFPAHIEMSTPDLREMSRPLEIDPDVSATLTDFLTYTEHLPSAVARSMTLIAEQDRIAVQLQQTIHNLLTIYGDLPNRKSSGHGHDIPDSVTLRAQISIANAKLQRARRLAAAETYRLSDMVTRDRKRLQIITKKLKAMPMPLSRDPSPKTNSITSPTLATTANPIEKKPNVSTTTASAPRIKGQQLVVIPGEVLPPMEHQPPAFDTDDSESDESIVQPAGRALKQSRRDRIKLGSRHGPVRPPKTPKKAARHDRPPTSATQNNAAGAITSSAMLSLVAPPDDAKDGSIWKPWKRITEFELARLRKRMKKNAIWLPSPAMRNRELKMLGRGADGADAARAHAEQTGEHFIDEYTSDWQDPTRAVVSAQHNPELAAILASPARAAALSGDDDDLGQDPAINRGMLLNEAKKRKREREHEEQAAEAAGLPAPVTGTETVSSPRTSAIEQSGSPRRQRSPPKPLQLAPAATRIPRGLRSPIDIVPSIEQDGHLDQATNNVAETITGHSTEEADTKPELLAEALPRAPSLSQEPATAEPAAHDVVSTVEEATLQGVVAEEHAESVPASEAAQDSDVLAPSSPARKRKREVSPVQDCSTAAGPEPRKKRLRISLSAPKRTPSIEPVQSPRSAKRATTTDSASSAIPALSAVKKDKTPAATSPQPASAASFGLRQSGRRSSKQSKATTQPLPRVAKQLKAASADPAPQPRRKSLRRVSNASLPESTQPKSPSVISDMPITRGSRRKSNPGLVTSTNEQGSARSSVSRRKPAPKKKARRKSTTTKNAPGEAEDADEDDEEEDDDPDAPRYCICDDIAHDDMIACENEKCKVEWYHFECMGLTRESIGRRDHWFCPECRKKVPMAPKNGIVREGLR